MFKGYNGWDSEKCKGEFRGSLLNDGAPMVFANGDRIHKGKCDKLHSRNSGISLMKLMVWQLCDKSD